MSAVPPFTSIRIASVMPVVHTIWSFMKPPVYSTSLAPCCVEIHCRFLSVQCSAVHGSGQLENTVLREDFAATIECCVI